MDSPTFESLAREFEETASNLTRNFFKTGSNVEYLFEEGSLRSRVKVIAQASLIFYTSVAAYPTFREGVAKIHADSIAFGEAVFDRFKVVTGATDKDILYKRGVSKDVNRLYRIVQHIDAIEDDSAPFRRDLVSKQLASEIAGLLKANPNDEVLQSITNIIPFDKIPVSPEDIGEYLAINIRKKKQVTEHETEHSAPIARISGATRQRKRYKRSFYI